MANNANNLKINNRTININNINYNTNRRYHGKITENDVNFTNEYNRAITGRKLVPKVATHKRNELFLYFKFLTVVRAYQLDPVVMLQSSDPFVTNCKAAFRNYGAFNIQKTLNKLTSPVSRPVQEQQNIGKYRNNASVKVGGKRGRG